MSEHFLNEDYEPLYQNNGFSYSDIGMTIAHTTQLSAVNASSGTEGIYIPYYDIDGSQTGNYRILAKDAVGQAYLYPERYSPALYFPKNFIETINKQDHEYVLMFNREDEAYASCVRGFAAVAIGGLIGWRINTFDVSNKASIIHRQRRLGGRMVIQDMKSDSLRTETIDKDKPAGWMNFINYCSAKKFKIAIVSTITDDEMRNQDNDDLCFQACLEIIVDGEMIGRAGRVYCEKSQRDFVFQQSHAEIMEAIKSTFGMPRHPNISKLVSEMFDSGVRRKSRSTASKSIMAIIADMDARGKRIISSKSGEPLYFDDDTKTIYYSYMRKNTGNYVMDDRFGGLLDERYSVTSHAQTTTDFLSTRLKRQEPIYKKEVYKGFAVINDSIYLQISDSKMIALTNNGYGVVDNGFDGVMFEPLPNTNQYMVMQIDEKKILKELQNQSKNFKPILKDMLSEIHINKEYSKSSAFLSDVLPLFFYMSPILNRWKNMQLPIELIVGETAHGKTSFCGLKMLILLGYELFVIPQPTKKNLALSIMQSPPIHCMDNFVWKDIKNLAYHDMRALYSNLATAPQQLLSYHDRDVAVNCVFQITSIKQPFHKAPDFESRSLVIPLKMTDSKRVGNWQRMMVDKYGGREKLLANMLLAIKKFLMLANESWDNEFSSDVRLSHVEQGMRMMAKIIGVEDSIISQWIASRNKEIEALQKKHRKSNVDND